MAPMRGDDRQPRAMFSYVSAEERVPQEHPLRAIRTFVDEILREMTREFDALYAQHGRPSIPPERLLRAQLLQLFYSIRSERLLMEQLDYNILFRWFVGLEMDEPVWVPTVFTKNRDRLLQHAVAHSFFQRVVARASALFDFRYNRASGSVVDACVSFFRSCPRLYRKSNNAEARLAYLGHVLMENRHGLIVDAQATVADGFAEREAATTMLSTHWRHAPPRHRTVGADKAYDTADFVDQVREIDMTAHVAQNDTRRGGSAIDGRTTRHTGYAISQQARPRIERAFGWLKTIAGLRKVKLRGLATVDALFVLASAAFNIKRIVALRAAAA